jgi:hypothetical protein
VPAIALDDVKIRGRVRLIKMDVEGAEPLVIRGAARLLAEHRPVILSELHPTQLDRASGMTPDQFLEQLRTAGYRARTIDGAPIDRAPSDALVSVVLEPIT